MTEEKISYVLDEEMLKSLLANAFIAGVKEGQEIMSRIVENQSTHKISSFIKSRGMEVVDVFIKDLNENHPVLNGMLTLTTEGIN